jgi:hypothetical protein
MQQPWLLQLRLQGLSLDRSVSMHMPSDLWSYLRVFANTRGLNLHRLPESITEPEDRQSAFSEPCSLLPFLSGDNNQRETLTQSKATDEISFNKLLNVAMRHNKKTMAEHEDGFFSRTKEFANFANRCKLAVTSRHCTALHCTHDDDDDACGKKRERKGTSP